MNRVFSPDLAIDVEVFDPPPMPPQPPAPPVASQAARATPPGGRRPAGASRARAGQPSAGQAGPSALMLASVSLAITTVAGLGLVAVQLRNHDQQAIRQERNLLMLERLRSMGPAAPDAVATIGTVQSGAPAGGLEAVPGGVAGAEDGLPPPPPAEPWMQELATLPPSTAPPARVLKVPMNGSVGRAAPPATAARPAGSAPTPGGGGSAGGPAPQLIGVVQSPGRGGSAIFQIGGASTSASVGESIGGSGWRLHSANGESAVIERNGEQRLISISSGG